LKISFMQPGRELRPSMIHGQLRQSAAAKSIADKAAAIMRRWFHVVQALRYCGQNAIAAAGSVIDAS